MSNYLPQLNAPLHSTMELSQLMGQMGGLSLERMEHPSLLMERLVVVLARCTQAYVFGAPVFDIINPAGFTDSNRIFIPIERTRARLDMLECVVELLLCKAGMAAAADKLARHCVDRGLLYSDGHIPHNSCTPETLDEMVLDEMLKEALNLGPDRSRHGMNNILQTTLHIMEGVLGSLRETHRAVALEMVGRFAYGSRLREPVLAPLVGSLSRLLDGQALEGCTPLTDGSEPLRRL